MTKAIESWVKRNETKFQSVTEKNHLVDFLMSEFPHKQSLNFTYESCVEKTKIWMNALHKKASLQKGQGETRIILTFPDGFKIVQLLDDDATAWEGLQMGHCVGSGSYNPENIYSLRDPKGVPHATMEIEDKELVEFQGKANNPLAARYMPYCIEFFNQNEIDGSSHIDNFSQVSLEDFEKIQEIFTNIMSIKSYRGRSVYKPSLKEKDNVNYSLYDINMLSPFLDGTTAPSFFLNYLTPEINKKLQRCLSVKGWEYLALLNKERAFEVYQMLSEHGNLRAGALPTLLKLGYEKEVIEKLENFSDFIISNSGRKTISKLIKMGNQEVNERILRMLNGPIALMIDETEENSLANLKKMIKSTAAPMTPWQQINSKTRFILKGL